MSTATTPSGIPSGQPAQHPPLGEGAPGAGPESIADKLRRRGHDAALLPLRAFLGATFVFAGLQKLANPNFFNRASPISIWAQLAGAERTSPLHAILGHLLRVSTPLGLLIAAGEVAIGLGILLGLLTRVAATGGMLLSFGLFLTVSFHSNPYYTGADIVFFFALTPLLLAGPGPLLALDPVLARRALETNRAGSAQRPARPWVTTPAGTDLVLVRRTLLSRAAAGVGLLGLAAMGLDGLIGRAIGGAGSAAATPVLGGNSASTTTASPSRATTTGPTGPSSTTVVPNNPPGSALGPAKDVPVGGSASFTDPATGDPGIVIQQKAGHFVAFDAVCPHAGCTVGYSAANDLIVCPCHGSEFNPSTGAVVAGPAPHGLRPIAVAEGGNGELYVV